MRAAVVTSLGKAPAIGDFPQPQVQEGEVLIKVAAAALKPLDRAVFGGNHYIKPTLLPLVAGMDGVGRAPDGQRLFFLWPRAPFGSMAEYTVVEKANCYPVPEGVSDRMAAALFNPGMAAWLPLVWRAELKPTERILILGATGTAGSLAVQLAKRLGAGRLVVAGRNPTALAELRAMGADAEISLSQSPDELAKAFLKEDFDVVIDYVWGPPTQALLTALGQKGHGVGPQRVRLVQVGAGAGPTLTLPAELLRGKGLELSGTGFGSTPKAQERAAFEALMAHAALGELTMATEEVPLGRIGEAWTDRNERRRLIVIP